MSSATPSSWATPKIKSIPAITAECPDAWLSTRPPSAASRDQMKLLTLGLTEREAERTSQWLPANKKNIPGRPGRNRERTLLHPPSNIRVTAAYADGGGEDGPTITPECLSPRGAVHGGCRATLANAVSGWSGGRRAALQQRHRQLYPQLSPSGHGHQPENPAAGPRR